MTTILTELHGSLAGIDASGYLTSPTGAKFPALGLGTSGSEVLLTATGTEINRACDTSARIVSVSSAQNLSITEAAHDKKIVNLASAKGTINLTLPAATGTGTTIDFVVTTSKTSGAYNILGSSKTQIMHGNIVTLQDSSNQVVGWETAATTSKISLNGTTTGGIAGSRITLRDMGSAIWQVDGITRGTGNEATPFSSQ